MPAPKNLERYAEWVAEARERRIGKTWGEIFGEETAIRMRAQKRAVCGENHPNWKYGSRPYQYKLMEANGIPRICVECGTNRNIQIHHKNRNPYDNHIENLEFRCIQHHRDMHPVKPNRGCFKKGLIPWNKGLRGIEFTTHYGEPLGREKGFTPWWVMQGFASLKAAAIAVSPAL